MAKTDNELDYKLASLDSQVYTRHDQDTPILLMQRTNAHTFFLIPNTRNCMEVYALYIIKKKLILEARATLPSFSTIYPQKF